MMTKLRLSFTMLLLLMASMGFAGPNTVGERSKTTDGEGVQYQLVTSVDEITTGRYLIVFTNDPNEGQALAFDGSLETLNVQNNTQEVIIENGVITTDKDIYFNINIFKRTVQSASGFYIGQTSSTNGLRQSVDTLYSHSFVMDDNGHAMIYCDESGGTVFLGFDTRTNQQRFLYGNNRINRSIYLFKAVEEPFVKVTIGESGYETLYCGSYSLMIPDGITASVVTNADVDGNLQLEPLGEIIPAATGVIIQGEPIEYEFPIFPDYNDGFEGNMLKGSDGAAYTHGDGKYYLLSLGDNGIGFYWGEDDGGEFINEPHKAYLVVPESDAAVCYPFDRQETNVFILGEVNGNSWAANEGVQMEYISDGYYTATITTDGRNDGYNYFSFTTQLADNDDDGGWAYIEPSRFGAVSEGDFLVTDDMLGESLSLTYDNGQAFKIPEGKYTLTLNIVFHTLVIEKVDEVYILGNIDDNDWAANVGGEMLKDDDSNCFKAYITADGRDNGYNTFSFSTKLAKDANDWDSIEPNRFGAVSQGDFLVTDEMFNQDLSLTYDNPQAFRIPKGEYYLYLDLDNLTLNIKDMTPIPDVFILGEVNGNSWDPDEGVQMSNVGKGLYTATITADGCNEGYNYFSFTTELGDDWDEITSYRFGAISQGDFRVTSDLLGTEISLTYDNPQAFRIPAGEYLLTLNLDNFKLIIDAAVWNGQGGFCGNVKVNRGRNLYYEVTGEGEQRTLTIHKNPAAVGNDFSMTDNPNFMSLDPTVLIIEDGVTTIGKSAFKGCSSLTSVTIPNSVTTIGESAFKDCSSLPSITIPDNVTTIDEGAFRLCSSLTSVSIGSGVTTIGNCAFKDCDGLPSITIPDNVTTIGESAFASCSSLTSVTIGSGVTTIVKCAFEECSSLPSITIPDNVTTIDEFAFHACKNLSSVTFGCGVKTIGNSAFEYCISLTSVTIPQSVTFIGNNAFYWCDAIEDVYCYALPNKLTWDEGDCNDFKMRRETRCHVYDVSSWSSFESEVNVIFVEDLPVKFYDTADNSDLVESLSNKTKEVTLADHTFFADGKWNTLCLPFSLTSLTGTPLEGFTVKELDTSTAPNGHQTGLEDGTLYLNFKDATGIEAGKPYLVRKEMGDVSYVPCTADRGTKAQSGYQDNVFDYRGLVDGTTDRRWRTNAPTTNNPCYCEFHTQDPVTMTRYVIAATNLAAYSNPKVWTLYGKLNETDAWTVIDSRDTGANPGDALPVATRTKNFNIASENQGAYKYYRFEVTQSVDPSVANLMVMSELYMYGAQTAIENPVFSNVTIKGDAPAIVSSSDGKVAFVGSYAPRTSSSGMLCVSSGNKIGRLAKGQEMGAQHAAFLTGLNSEGKPVGDVNSDGEANISDVTNLVNRILSSNTAYSSIADVNGDGSVTITDVTSLVDIILGRSGVVINNVITNIDLLYSGTGVSPARGKKLINNN